MSHLLTLHDPAAAREHYLSGIWQIDTLYSLARRHATERASAYAVRDSARRLTWSALVAWVDAVAADLHDAGLRRGDRISIWLPNRLESTVVLLACSRNGYVCNPSLHQNYTVEEVVALLSRIECRALFAQPGWGADASAADIFARAGKLDSMKRVYALPGLRTPDGSIPPGTHALPMPGQQPRIPAPPASTHPDQIVYLAFTSGTTGTPKGVMHSDNTLLANGRAMVADWGQNHGTVLLTLSPMSHHIGTVALEQVLVAGCELVLHDPSAGIAALDWIETTGALEPGRVFSRHVSGRRSETRRTEKRSDRLLQLRSSGTRAEQTPRTQRSDPRRDEVLVDLNRQQELRLAEQQRPAGDRHRAVSYDQVAGSEDRVEVDRRGLDQHASAAEPIGGCVACAGPDADHAAR